MYLFGLFSVFGDCEKSYWKHLLSGFCMNMSFHFLGQMPMNGTAEAQSKCIFHFMKTAELVYKVVEPSCIPTNNWFELTVELTRT